MCNVRPFNQLVPRLPTGDLFGPIYSERALRLFGKGTDARANYEDINGKDVKSLINKDKWNLNTKLYHNKYQLNKMKKVVLLEYKNQKVLNPNHHPPRRIWHPCGAAPGREKGMNSSWVSCPQGS